MRRREYAAARLLLEQAGPWGEDNDGCYFALAGVCYRLGDAGATMRALEVAHALQTSELRVSNADLLEPEAPWLAEGLTQCLNWDLQPPIEKQMRYATVIARELNMTLSGNAPRHNLGRLPVIRGSLTQKPRKNQWSMLRVLLLHIHNACQHRADPLFADSSGWVGQGIQPNLVRCS